MKKSSILILATNFPSIKIFTWFFFKNPNTFQTRFSQIRNQIKKLIPEISPMIIDQSKLSSNRSPTSNLLSPSLSRFPHDNSLSSHALEQLFPGNDVPIRWDYLKLSSLSLSLSPFFLNSRAQPRGDRRVSVRSTLPFIRPSPVSSGLTSPSSLCAHLVLMVATRGKVTRERPTLPGSPPHPRRFTSLLLRLRGPATLARAQPPKTVVHALLLFCLPSARPWIKGRLSCLSRWVTYFLIF